MECIVTNIGFVRSHYPEVEGMELPRGVLLISGATWNYDVGGYVALANVNGMLALVELRIYTRKDVYIGD